MGVNWKGLIGGIAPVLAKALVNPGAGAAAAVSALSKALLGHEHATEPEIAAAIAGATPEQIARIQDAERDFSLKLIDSAVALEKLEGEDRANARAREVALKDRMPAVLAIVLTTGLFAAIAMLATVEIPNANREPLMLLVGSLGTTWGAAMAYYHGSSSSSRAKDVVIGRIANEK